MDAPSFMKTFTFYYKSASQTLSLATGSTQAEIIETLRIIFGVPADKKLLFLGEDGNLVILSSALPSGMKLTMLDEDYQISQIQGPKAEGKWKWKKGGRGALVDDYTIKTDSEGKVTAYGDIKMTKGKHWWRIKIKLVFCCQDFGITKSSIKEGFWKSKPEEYHETIGFPDTFPGETSGPGSTGCSYLKWENHIFLFYLDMDTKRFVIINETLNRLINDVKVTFDCAIPFMHSNKHDNLITLVDAGEGEIEAKFMKLIPKK